MSPHYERAISPYYDIDKWQIIANNAWGDCTSTNMSTMPTTINVTTAAQQTMTYDVQTTVQTIYIAEQATKPQGFRGRRRKVVPDAAFAPLRTPPPRNFNKYINASDLLEEFIRYVGTEGVRQREVLGLPIELFVKWLVIRACEEDAEEPNVTLELPTRKTQPRCLGCQQYMCRDTAIPIHGHKCATRYFERAA